MNTHLFRIFLAAISLAVFTISNATAQGILAADISYEHIANNKYKVILTVYKECNIGSPDAPGYQVDYSSINCGLRGPFNVRKATTKRVSSCGNQVTVCDGGPALGFDKITYSGEVDLPSRCNDWKITWTDDNRSEKITNISQPVLKSIYIEALLNNKDFPSNSSPIFSEPISFVTVGGNAKIPLGGKEKDGDRIEYELVAPSDRSNLLLPYVAPFTFRNPLTSSPAFALDSKTGEVTLTPTKAGERTVYAVKITEYRNNIIIGHTVRDLQISVLDGKNASPVIGGFNNGQSTEVTFVTDRNNSASISASDSDISQKLEMTGDRGALPTAASLAFTSGTSTARGTLSWRPTDSDIGTKTFTITVKDDFCPSSEATKTFTVKVIKNTAPPPNPLCANFRASMSVDTLCAGKPSAFTNFSSPSTNITSYAWDFGNGMVFDKRTPDKKVYFDKPGDYTLKLIVKDDKNKCADTLERKLKVCESPKVDFTVTSEDELKEGTFRNVVCEGHSLKIEDKTPPVCTVLSKKIVLSNGQSFPFTDKIYIIDKLSMSGAQSVKVEIVTEGVCKGESSQNLLINGRPKITTIKSYTYKCNDLDTTISVAVVGGAPFIKADTENRYKYSWSGTPIKDVDITPNATSRTVKYTFKNLKPVYTGRVVVSDSLTCTADTIFTVSYPLVADFHTSPYCQTKQEINFVTKDLINSVWGIKSYEWSLGDGTKSVSPDLKHTYPTDSIYPISLKVIDNSLCENIVLDTVYNKLPVRVMSISEDSICLQGGSMFYDGPYFTGKSKGINYDWTWGSQQVSNSKKNTYFASSSATNPFKVSYEYNITDLGSCKETLEKPLTVRELVNVKLDSIVGKCIPEPAKFYITQNAGKDPITSFDWKFNFRDPATRLTSVVNSSNLEDPIISFENNGLHNIKLKITDAKGCVNATIPEYEFSPVRMRVSCVRTSGYCQSEKLKFFYKCLDVSIPPPGGYARLESQIWDLGDGTRELVEEPNHPYLTADTFIVKYVGYSDLDQKGCKSEVTDTLIIYPQPVADFSVKSECVGTTLNFEGNSKPSNYEGDTIRKYKWTFSNSYTTTDSSGTITDTLLGRNRTYFPKFPTQTLPNDTSKLIVSYITTNRFGCEDTMKREVVVYPKPKADFEPSDEDLEAFKSVQFKDKSFSAPPSNLSSWTYDFGDENKQTSLSNGNMSHTYNEIKIYSVKLLVKNNFGCTDSITKKLDLNAYLEVPNTITPNDDKEGDKFELVHKGIKKVNSYKIYNRWGQVVFDGANDLSAAWDGTFNGEQQPMGVYVYYVSATTIYGTEIVLSKNLTLIR